MTNILGLRIVRQDIAYEVITLSGDKIEVGDKEESTFKPQFQLNRWSGECRLKVLFDDSKVESTSHEVDSQAVYWHTPSFSFKFYPIEPKVIEEEIEGERYRFLQNELGGLEFEIILKEKPEKNEFIFPIETENLKFYYQPPLHPDHPTWADEDGDGMPDTFRPENVVGSYAVYHATRDNVHYSKEDAERYKAGKAFHIYRPKAVDSAENECWCDLNIDEANGLLTITIPQEFLDKAVYPVIIDPTFGYEYVGNSAEGSISDYIKGSWFTCPESGTAESITFYLPDMGFDEGPRKLGIYKKSDNSFVGETAEYSGGTADSWITYELESPKPSLSNEDYYLVHWGEEYALSFDTATDRGAYQLVGYPGSWPDPWSPQSCDKKYCIYCTYTAAGGEVTRSITSKVDTIISKRYSLSYKVNTLITSRKIKNFKIDTYISERFSLNIPFDIQLSSPTIKKYRFQSHLAGKSTQSIGFSARLSQYSYNLHIYHPSYSADFWCLRWDEGNWSITLELLGSKESRNILLSNITPGAVSELYNILGQPKYIDTTFTSGNTFWLIPKRYLASLRDSVKVACKNYSDTLLRNGMFHIKMECVKL